MRHTIRPGDRVLDLGAGLGTYAFLAADAGAGRVWAVDGHPVIHVAKTVAQLNGYGDRVTFLRGWIPETVPPEPADVVIFEDFPPRLLDARVWRMLRDLRPATVRSGARFVPSGARILAAPLESDALAAELTLDRETLRHGLDWEATRSYVSNQPHSVTIPLEALLGEGAVLASFAFGEPLDGASLGGEAAVQVRRDGQVHGLAYWFELELGGGERLSNQPGAAPASWGQLYLPVDPPLPVAAGETVRLKVRPERLADGAPGWLAWEVATRSEHRRGHEFQAAPLGLEDLRSASGDVVPCLNDLGRLTVEALALVDGKRTAREITDVLAAQRPGIPRLSLEALVVRQFRGRIVSGPGRAQEDEPDE
ncbi:MAG TPA: class I SAM-dependent methyltransferase [Gemmatimonadales bacterium]|nr:class I SAM-dependent methyltransferase [Gemmatimonadales bacterium]